MQKMSINKPSVLRILLGVYLFPLWMVCFSLSVPPADLPLCGLMFVIAAFGWVLARRESRGWRVLWMSALIVSILCAGLEIVAGKRIAHQRSKDAASLRFVKPTPCPLPRAKNSAREGENILLDGLPRALPWATIFCPDGASASAPKLWRTSPPSPGSFGATSRCGGILLEGRGGLRQIEGARAHGMWTYESRQGRNAATAVCSASAVVTLALFYFGMRSSECGTPSPRPSPLRRGEGEEYGQRVLSNADPRA
jgi:hypothetical protein